MEKGASIEWRNASLAPLIAPPIGGFVCG